MAPVFVLTLSILASVVTSVLLLERFAPCTSQGNARAARVLPISNYRFLASPGKFASDVFSASAKQAAEFTQEAAKSAARSAGFALYLKQKRRRRETAPLRLRVGLALIP
jgi:hypothetical protein